MAEVMIAEAAMRRKVDPAADLAELARLVATETAFRVRDGDNRPVPEIARQILLEIASFPKLGRQIHILRRRIAARRPPTREPAVIFT